jgi:uncharacterized protein YukE
MPRAIVDPAELRRFANTLGALVGKLRDRRGAMNSHYKSLRDFWQDKKYEQFDRTFAEAMARLDRFAIESERYVKYLSGKAAKAERYLEGGYGR